ncbi:MAG: peptidylprolyl isomerase [Chloroflexota bacterium]
MPTLRRFSLLLLILALAACGPKPGPVGTDPVSTTVASLEAPTGTPTITPTPVPAAALVNGEIISQAEFEAEVSRLKAAQADLGLEISDDEAAGRALDELIDQVLLAQAAQAEGYSLDEAALDARIESLAADMGGAEALSAWRQAQGYTEAGFRSALRRALAAAWMRDQIIASVPPTAEQVHVKQILLYNQERANNVLAQLQAGSDFDDLAALFDPVTRGEMGWFPRGYLLEPAIEEAAFALEPGRFSDVIVTGAGFHIIRVVERAERALSADAYLSLQEKALAGWLDQQRQLSTITLTP